jgi:putative lipoprotein
VAADRLVLVADYGERRLTFPLPEPAPGASPVSTVYRSEAGGHRIEVLIVDEPCRDSMSGEPFPATVVVRLDDQILPGCGGPVDGSPPDTAGTQRP